MSALFPPEYWELLELVVAGCPDEALKAHRTAIFRGKPKMLDAKGCDNAIRAGKGTDGRYGSWNLREYSWREESPESTVSRLKMYKENDWPLIFARRTGTPAPEAVQLWVRLNVPAGYPARVLEFDETHVDRVTK